MPSEGFLINQHIEQLTTTMLILMQLTAPAHSEEFDLK